MSLVPFSNKTNRNGSLTITVDKMGRLCLSSSLRRELDTDGKPISLYVSYDKVNKRIGIAKPTVVRLTDVIPYKFDGPRGYTMARNFLKANQIQHDTAYRYEYDGKENGWLTFRLEGYEAPDQPDA
ncbi:hypothetical protein [Paenibacillus terrigena]|uniref:hypothetical protein n=1 Tax=Paenibacillus terrigena TaxID=369333 RepID=UPI00037948E1|nr:hypothetical protein [Paenibacillus terrigena]